MSLYSAIVLAVFVFTLLFGRYIGKRATHVFSLSRGARWVLGVIVIAAPFALYYGRREFEPGRDWLTPWAIAGAAVVLGTLFAGVFLVHVDVARWVLRRLPRGRSSVDSAAGVGLSLEREQTHTIPADLGPTGDSKTTASSETASSETASSETASSETASSETASSETAIEVPATVMSRREAIASGFAISAGGFLGGYSATFGRHDYSIEEVVIPIAGLSPTLEGFTLAQISDVHIGQFVGEPELRSAQALIGSIQADLIVMTGDLIDHDARYAPQLGRFVRRLQPLARHGVAAIPGNHDYYAGIDEVLSSLNRAGAKVLRNSGRVIADADRGRERGGIALLGVDDLWSPGGPDLDRALRMVPEGLPRVLLCHQPEFFHANAGEIQAQLSGHTHGGQVSLGYEPARFVIPHGYVEGSYERQGSTLYVNRGFGTAGPPARLGAAPEITKIVLVRA